MRDDAVVSMEFQGIPNWVCLPDETPSVFSPTRVGDEGLDPSRIIAISHLAPEGAGTAVPSAASG